MTGVDNNPALEASVEVFPNPASDRVSIISNDAIIRHYALFDINSRLVRSNTVNSQRSTLEREGLKAGVYFVELHFDSGVVTRKVVLD